MPLDYNDPKVMKFLKESYDKENENRITWFVKNKEEITKAATLKEKHKGYRTEDVARALVEPLIPVLSLHHKVTNINRLTKSQIDNPGCPVIFSRKSKLQNKKTSDIDILEAKMKPVDPNDKLLLFGEEPLGRKKYLYIRNKIAPEERYYECETSNGAYGWRLCDSERIRQSEDHRLYDSLRRDGFGRSGLQPDPKHYGTFINQYTICNL